MNNPWNSDIALTLDVAKQAIQDQGWDSLKLDHMQYLSEGWDNVAFLINHTWVFRFPKRAEAEIFLLHENMILPALQETINLSIPNPVYLGQPTQQYPFHFHGYEMLQGIPFYKVNLSYTQLQDCVVLLAQFLKALHRMNATQAGHMGLQFQVYDKTKVDLVVTMLQQRIKVLQAQNVVSLDMNFIEQMIKQARSIHLDHAQDCLVHGDLDARHLLLTDKKLSGVIDWGDVGINHPVIDLAVVTNIFPVSLHELFFKEYGFVSADVYNYARFLTLYRAVTLMMYSNEIGDTQMFTVAHRSYQRLLA